MKKIGMDFSRFDTEHKGGKDEVAYLLLQGFQALGVAGQLVCFCHEDLLPKIRRLAPDAECAVLPAASVRARGTQFLLDTWNLRRLAKQFGLHKLLFTNKITPPCPFPVPTCVIPHDIQPMSADKYTLNPMKNLRKAGIVCDFLFRDQLVAISDYDRQQFLQFFPWARKKIVRIYDPVRFASRVDPSAEKKYILALNIQHGHKNIETLLRAYARIADRIPCRLVLAGRKSEEYQPQLDMVVAKHHLEEKVIFPGFVPAEALEKLIQQTRLFVNPSLFEGFGMPAVEMMGRCVPTLVSRCAAVPEVTMGRCLYYDPPTDDEALANAILQEMRKPMSDAALEEASQAVRQKYDYLHISKEYWDMLTDERA